MTDSKKVMINVEQKGVEVSFVYQEKAYDYFFPMTRGLPAGWGTSFESRKNEASILRMIKKGWEPVFSGDNDLIWIYKWHLSNMIGKDITNVVFDLDERIYKKNINDFGDILF